MKISQRPMIFSILLAMLIICSATAWADDYRIGQGDVLDIKYWQQPTANTTVVVDLDGWITVDVIGRIKAAGKTTEELQRDIVRQVSRLNKNISQAVVVVTDYNYQFVFVTGQINSPGKFSFEVIPDLWTLINEAGGVTETGDLNRITIIRGGDDGGDIEIVDLGTAIALGKLDDLPELRRGDAIEVPRTIGGVISGGLTSQVQKKNVIYVIGAVNVPGPIDFEENMDILDALALAGGPSATADLKKSKIVSKGDLYAQSLHYDLNKYTETGALPRYILKREDTFIIPQQSGGFFGGGIGTIAAAVGIISSAILIYTQLKPEDDPVVITAE